MKDRKLVEPEPFSGFFPGMLISDFIQSRLAAYKKVLPAAITLMILGIYGAYIAFLLHSGRGPVDFETFMGIGQKFVDGKEVYGENSYYPFPYIMIFGLFSLFPREVSIVVWLLLPIIAALIITRFQPWVVLYAPLIGHFLGGQSSLFGMIGIWGYRKCHDCRSSAGGIWLALTLLKPQLAVIPVSYAIWNWIHFIKREKQIPRQMTAFNLTALLIFAPAFLVRPDWIIHWVENPRPLFERALAGMLPRTLMVLIHSGLIFWVTLTAGAVLLLGLVWKLSGDRLNLDLLFYWYFCVSPFVHDYDLIQLIPLLEKRREQWAAVLLGIPTILVIIFYYANDKAWFAVTMIPVGLLFFRLRQNQHP